MDSHGMLIDSDNKYWGNLQNRNLRFRLMLKTPVSSTSDVPLT